MRMKDIQFQGQCCKVVFNSPDNDLDFMLKMPKYCPVCGEKQVPQQVKSFLFPPKKGKQYGSVCYECSSCGNYYIVTYDIVRKEKAGFVGSFCPEIRAPKFYDDVLGKLSSKYLIACQQAMNAEFRGDLELAAIGYRSALECVVKDYAIKELGKPSEEVVGKSLFAAIGEYLSEQKELLNTADVVRLLGNDYTHYERKYPEYDFDLLKQYFNIFTAFLRMKVSAAHPPLSRKK